MAPCWAQLWLWWGDVWEGRHCFSAKILTVGVAPSSQLLLVRNEELQGILWSLHGCVARAFSARDVFVGSGFTSVNVIELTCYCCFVNRWCPDIGHPWFLGCERWLLSFSDSVVIVVHFVWSAGGERRATTIRNTGVWALVLTNVFMVKGGRD